MDSLRKLPILKIREALNKICTEQKIYDGGTNKFKAWKPPSVYSGKWLIPHTVENGHILISIIELSDKEWIHTSISFKGRIPSYEELAMLHKGVFGKHRWAYQIFPPVAKHVNIDENTLHLWGRLDGTNELPDFTEFV